MKLQQSVAIICCLAAMALPPAAAAQTTSDEFVIGLWSCETSRHPYRYGTTHIVLEPVDFMARLAALVPPPRVHLTRYHGVFAPHAALRAAVTPAGRGSGAGRRAGTAGRALPRHVAMTWAARLQRVFGIEIERCARCGGRLQVIASIAQPELIARILTHRRERGAEDAPVSSLGPRAPPQAVLF